MENFTLDRETLMVGLAVFAAVFLFPRLRNLMNSKAQFITAAELETLLGQDSNITILDVRTPEEFLGPLGHIASSGNLPLAELQSRLNEVGEQLAEHKTEAVVVVCRTHNRSPKAANLLRRVGFNNIKVLKGGLTGWNKAGLPVKGGSAAKTV